MERNTGMRLDGEPAVRHRLGTLDAMHIFTSHLVLASVVLVLLAVLVNLARLWAAKQERRSTGGHAYEKIPELLTPAERSFFGVLRQAVGSDCQIFAKVRLADIITPVRNPGRSGWQAAFNRISIKHVDFVVCESASLRVIGVIELDDRSHGTRERGERDLLIDSALSSAGIPVLRVPASHAYSPAQIRKQMGDLFGIGGAILH